MLKKVISVFICLVIVMASMATPVSAVNPSASEMATKLNDLRSRYPSGKTDWGNYKGKAWECMGFAALIWDNLFGEDWYITRDYALHSNINDLYIGDHVRFKSGGSDHSITIIDIKGDTIVYVDANGGSVYNVIQWDRTISRSDLGARVAQRLNWGTSRGYLRDYGYIQHHNGNSVGSLISTPTLPSTSADIPNGVYALQDKSSKKYVSTGLTNVNGYNTYIHEWANNNDQKFTIERQSDNTYKIISRWSGKVLDVRNMETQNGVNITQFDWWGGDNQKWYIVDCGLGWYKLIAKHSGKAMDVIAFGNTNGSSIGQWDDNGAENQRFRLIPQNLPSASVNIPNGIYSLQHKGSGKYVAMGVSKDNGILTYLWERTLVDDQKFTFERLPDNTYKIVSRYSGKTLDSGLTNIMGTGIYQWEWAGGDNQKWYIVDCGSGLYKFVSKFSGQVMDVSENGSANGTRINQWPDNGNDAQRFRLLCQSNHNYSAWNVTKPATETSTGTKTRTCSICKNIETEIIPKLSPTSIPVSSIKISKVSMNMVIGETFTLTASISPSNATNKTITWTSSNSSIASVSGGKVTAKSPGTTTITAKSSNGKTATCTVKVTAALTSKVTYVSMRIGKTAAIQNGNLTTIDNTGAKPFKIDGRTMLPVRFIGEKMGGTVKYVNDKTPITITSGKKKVELTLNSKTMYVIENGKKTKLTIDVPAQKRNGRTYLPLRAISESLGFDVYYKKDGSAEYIIVNSSKMTTAVKNARIAEAKAGIK